MPDPETGEVPPGGSAPSTAVPLDAEAASGSGAGSGAGGGRAAGRLKRLDFPDVLLYPHRDFPADRHVRIGPPNSGNFDWWNVPNAVHVVVRTKREIYLLERRLGPFLHLGHSTRLGGQAVPRGLQLVAAKPYKGRLREYPRLGYRHQLLTDRLPIELTFGGRIADQPPQPNDTPIMERKLEYTRPYDVKRLDFVFQPRQSLRDSQPEGMLPAPAQAASGFLEVHPAALGRPSGGHDFLSIAQPPLR